MSLEIFNNIFESYGYPQNSSQLTPEEIKNIPSDFPNEIHEFFEKYGRSIFRNGLIQACYPSDFRDVLALIFNGDKHFNHNEYHVFAYSAFGEIHLWNNKFGGGNLMLLEGRIIFPGITQGIDDGANINNDFYGPFSYEDDVHDFDDIYGKPLFKRAVKKLGPLDIGECYGFFPALGLGGSPELEYLKRVKAPEHFAIIAQTMKFNLIDVQGYGQEIVVRPIG